MKKEYLLFLLIGAGAVYFIMNKKKKRRGSVTVESPKKITEREFEGREPSNVSDLKALGSINLF